MGKLNVFGSARIDAFLELSTETAGKSCKLDTKECFIELSYASKLPLKNVEFLVGGNGANVAVGTNKLGIEGFLIAELGQGPVADIAYKELKKHLNIKYISQTPGMKQGFGAVIVYQGERTILSYYSPGRPPFPGKLELSEWAYLTSVGDKFEEYYDEVLNWVTKNNADLAFNPGGRQIRMGGEWLRKILAKTKILLVNREEAEEITGLENTHGKEKDLLQKLDSMGSLVNVVTDGTNGSYALESGSFYHVGILPIDAIERTGAGDSYSSGFISAVIKGKSIEEAMLWGTVNAASVIGYVGPQPGLLTSSDMKKWLERAKSSGVVVEKF